MAAVITTRARVARAAATETAQTHPRDGESGDDDPTDPAVPALSRSCILDDPCINIALGFRGRLNGHYNVLS